MNMIAQLVANIEKLKDALSEELDQISQTIIQDLNSNGTQIMDVDQLDCETGLPEEQRYFVAIGFGSPLFQTTLQRLKDESQRALKDELNKYVREIVAPMTTDASQNNTKLNVFKKERKNETLQTTLALVDPLSDLNLVIDNAEYERYDAEDVFIAEFIGKLKKVLRQWKQKLSGEGQVFPVLLQEYSRTLSHHLKEEIRNSKLSLLGALYLEKVIRRIKSFIQFLSDRAQSNVLEDVLEMAQLLACENLEEIENFLREQGYVTNDFTTVTQAYEGEKRHLQMEEIADILLIRDDLRLTEEKINRFLADLS